jgi:cell division protein FtsB
LSWWSRSRLRSAVPAHRISDRRAGLSRSQRSVSQWGVGVASSAGRSVVSFGSGVKSWLAERLESSPLHRLRLPSKVATASPTSRRHRMAAAAKRWRLVLNRLWHAPSAEVRRRRTVVGVAAAIAVVVMAFSFPFSTLLSQHRQLSAAAAQLAAVRQENRQLLKQEKQLSSKAEIERRARQDYQLVEPGQTLYEILPGPGGSTGMGTAAGDVGDPGAQPLVPPSRASDLAPDPGLPAAPPPVSHGLDDVRSTGHGSGPGDSSGEKPASPSSFWSRVGDTLEFWR